MVMAVSVLIRGRDRVHLSPLNVCCSTGSDSLQLMLNAEQESRKQESGASWGERWSSPIKPRVPEVPSTGTML